MPDIVPISELRQDAAGIIKRLKSSKKPIFITQRGRASAVLVSTEDYERTQHEVEILKALAQGELEIERGEGADLETVFAKADDLLNSGE
jgi:prevent-host-death family protein